jgi:hypothetical protein
MSGFDLKTQMDSKRFENGFELKRKRKLKKKPLPSLFLAQRPSASVSPSPHSSELEAQQRPALPLHSSPTRMRPRTPTQA